MNITEYLQKRKINVYLFKYFYPEFLSILRKYVDSLELLEKKFKILGRKVGIYAGSHWKIKSQNLKKLTVDAYKYFSGTKKFKVISHEDSLEIIDRNCAICWSAVEPVKMRYCIILAGFGEGFLTAITNKFNLPYKEFTGDTLKSRSSGDSYCWHEYVYVKK